MSTTTDKPRARALPPLMTLSEAAAERLTALYANAEQGKLLRIGIKTKGCSGMAYDLTFVDAAGPTDERVTDRGITKVKPMSAGFTFVNPNEKGRCGCGESFHV
ncbi:MAG: iron-sulfur cluster assembly accessory protein [Alphaproteobacteria bacterium]|nr:iron-sulfur cluster assembly accessory protein [Alphaproteobacteria bacterium]